MAVSYVRFVLLFYISTLMLQDISCDLLACETKRCNEIQWEGSALALNIPQLCSLIENSSTISHAFLQNQQEQQNDLYLHEIKDLFQNQTETLTQMADTQTQIANNTATVQDFQQNLLMQQSENHDEIKNLFHRQTETLTQIAATQAQMANAFDQVVALLQMQSQELKNMSTTVVSELENQQETLENISRSLPVVLEQQANQTELLSQCQPRPKCNCSNVESNSFKTTQATITATTPTTMTSTQDTTTLRSVESPIHDCSELVANGRYPSSVYTITPTNGVSFNVYCDMDTADGGWTVFQKRFNGSVDFYRGWDEYEQGFGDLNSEFWLGLRKIHQLTQSGSWDLRIDLEDFKGDSVYAMYNSFQIGDAASNYTLSIGSYHGTAGDSLILFHNNMQFTTYDRDNDVHSSVNCADNRQGAWWYPACGYSNLNGLYLGQSRNSWHGVLWYHWKLNQSLKKSEMKIRRVQ